MKFLLHKFKKTLAHFHVELQLCVWHWQEILQFRNSAATIIVANALMMTSPLDALAETCEVDNSPFNMLFNMPILLLVALIGATVGGKVLKLCVEPLSASFFLFGLSTLNRNTIVHTVGDCRNSFSHRPRKL